MNSARDLFFEHHPDPMWLYDSDSLAFIDVNSSALTQYGYSREEFLGMTIADIRAAEDVAGLVDFTNAGTAGLRDSGIWHHRSKSGEIIFVHVMSHPTDYQGRSAVLVSARNVTRLIELERKTAALLENEVQTRRRTEAASYQLHATNLRPKEQDANLRTAQRLLGLGMWKLELDSRALWWSDNLYDMYGTSTEDFGHTVEAYIELVHPDDRPEMVAQFEAFDASPGPSLAFRHRICRPDGGIVHVRGMAELNDTPNGLLLTGVVQDVTGQFEAAARLAEANSLVRLAGHAARLGGYRVELNPSRVVWTNETAAIHEMPEGTSPTLEDAINYYAPEHRSRIRGAFQACAMQGDPFNEILQLVTAKGNRVWVRAIGEAERDTGGGICAVQGALQDITELVAARERSEGLARRLRDTLESMSDAFFTLDEDWRFTFLNAQAERLLLRSRSELVGKVVWDEFPGAVGSTFQKEYERAAATRETVRFTEFYPDLDTWFQVSAYPAPEGLAVYFSDVTAERARAKQLQLLENAVSRQNDILLITEAEPIDEPDGPRIVYVNDAFVRRTGYSREEAIGRTPRFLQGPKTQRSELDRIRQAMRRWQPSRTELINYTKSGEEFWLELDLVPIADEKGWYTHWVAIERDVTERKIAEAEVRLSDERFQLVAKATSDVIWDWDLVHGTVWWNEAGRSLLGIEAAMEACGTAEWRDHMHPEDRSRVLHAIYRAIERGETNWVEDCPASAPMRQIRLNEEGRISGSS